jgi:hypothetical protein
LCSVCLETKYAPGSGGALMTRTSCDRGKATCGCSICRDCYVSMLARRVLPRCGCGSDSSFRFRRKRGVNRSVQTEEKSSGHLEPCVHCENPIQVLKMSSNDLECDSCGGITCLVCRKGQVCGCNAPQDRGMRFSRLFPGKRLRELDENHWSSLDVPECESNAFVQCSSCRSPLEKKDACNSLDHCERTVCNVCGASSQPWEVGLPQSHWDECPRYDAEGFALAGASSSSDPVWHAWRKTRRARLIESEKDAWKEAIHQ